MTAESSMQAVVGLLLLALLLFLNQREKKRVEPALQEQKTEKKSRQKAWIEEMEDLKQETKAFCIKPPKTFVKVKDSSKKKQVSLKNSYVKVNSDLEEIKRALEVTPSAKVLRLRSTAPARLQLGQKPRLIKRQVKSLKNMVINYEVMKAPLRNFYE